LRVGERQRCPWFFELMSDPRLKAAHGHAEFERMKSVAAAMTPGAGTV